MGKVKGAALLLAAMAWPGSAAAAPGTYEIRNASQTTMRCALYLTRGSNRYYSLTLQPGRAFRQTLETDNERQLSCSTNRHNRTQFRVRAGLVYELIETGRGALRLRSTGGN